ncbi:MAG: hypothetical protein GY938_11205, partial [Ketobacter sp.]|nr:hypothetical protein [Ketobacter sp.]
MFEASAYFYGWLFRLGNFEPSMMMIVAKAMRASKYAADYNCKDEDKTARETYAINKMFTDKNTILAAYDFWAELIEDHTTLLSMHRSKFFDIVTQAYANNAEDYPDLLTLDVDKEIDNFGLCL